MITGQQKQIGNEFRHQWGSGAKEADYIGSRHVLFKSQQPGLPDCTWDFRSWRGLAFDERQQVGIDGVRFRSGHAVREALVGFHGSVLQQLTGQRPGGDIGHDLVVFAVHDQHWDGDLLEVLREIGLGKGKRPRCRRNAPWHRPSCPGATNSG